MKKLSYLFSIAAIAFAMVSVSCDKKDNPIEPEEPVVPEPKIHDGDELASAIALYCEVINGVPTLNLPAGVSVVFNEPYEVNTPLSITGDVENPAKIKIGKEGKFIGGLQIKNAIIDATEMENPLITLGTEDAVVDEESGWPFTSVNLSNVTMTGLKKALVFSGCKNYDAFVIIDGSTIQVAADVTVFDFTKGSIPSYFNITASTFWAPTPTSKEFFKSQGGQKATDMGDDAIENFEFTNSTFYNLTKGKNFFSHRNSNQKWLAYTVKDCIFVNCGKSGQTVRGMNGGQGGSNPTWVISGNVFNYEGSDTSEKESTGDDTELVMDSKAVVVNFADPDNGDFTQAEVSVGDPRWIKQ